MTMRAGLYPDATIVTMEAQGVNPPSRADLLLELVPPRAGFHALLIECKSGDQGPDRSVYQLLAYRSALRSRFPGRMLVWGIVERAICAPTITQFANEGDVWVFSSADAIQTVLTLAGLKSD
jgi:hypothetical protein